ncbi:hypothetical protein INR49_009707 [Caranx melampygus]|nr:hypothetical protein INR49_009707 [Caranx melampygus]
MQTFTLNMNMDTLGKLAAPATAKIRLKSKPLPKVPARDYRDNDRDSDEELSDPDYDNDMFEDHHEDNYEPPPSHRALPTTPASFPRGEYLGIIPSIKTAAITAPATTRKPLRPDKASKQLPPEPSHMADEEDYISPDGSNDDDNYVEPAENPPSNFYEVPDKESVPNPNDKVHIFPPKPSPRSPQVMMNMKCVIQMIVLMINLQRVLFHAYPDLYPERRAFMVRKSSGHDIHQPYTLVVFYKGRVYNIPIRFIPGTQQYALGRQKRGEEVGVYFSSVSSIIENHQRTPLVLIDGQSNTKDATRLCFPMKP